MRLLNQTHDLHWLTKRKPLCKTNNLEWRIKCISLFRYMLNMFLAQYTVNQNNPKLTSLAGVLYSVHTHFLVIFLPFSVISHRIHSNQVAYKIHHMCVQTVCVCVYYRNKSPLSIEIMVKCRFVCENYSQHNLFEELIARRASVWV